MLFLVISNPEPVPPSTVVEIRTYWIQEKHSLFMLERVGELSLFLMWSQMKLFTHC